MINDASLRPLLGSIASSSNEDLSIKYYPRSKIVEFVESLHKYADIIADLMGHLGKFQILIRSDPSDTFIQKSPEKKRIVDYDIPGYALLYSLFTMPQKNREKLPPPFHILSQYLMIKKMRTDFIGTILEVNNTLNSPFSFDIGDIHYSLYRYETLVAEFDHTPIIFDLENFKKCIFSTTSHDEFPPYDSMENIVVIEEMIEEAIAFGIIPEKMRNHCKQWCSRLHSNLQDPRAIVNQEILSLSPRIQYISTTALGILERKDNKKTTIVPASVGWRHAKYELFKEQLSIFIRNLFGLRSMLLNLERYENYGYESKPLKLAPLITNRGEILRAFWSDKIKDDHEAFSLFSEAMKNDHYDRYHYWNAIVYPSKKIKDTDNCGDPKNWISDFAEILSTVFFVTIILSVIPEEMKDNYNYSRVSEFAVYLILATVILQTATIILNRWGHMRRIFSEDIIERCEMAKRKIHSELTYEKKSTLAPQVMAIPNHVDPTTNSNMRQRIPYIYHSPLKIELRENGGDKWKIPDQYSYEKCTEIPPNIEKKIFAEIFQSITEGLIEVANQNHYDFPWEIETLCRWVEYNLGKAVNQNAYGHEPTDNNRVQCNPSSASSSSDTPFINRAQDFKTHNHANHPSSSTYRRQSIRAQEEEEGAGLTVSNETIQRKVLDLWMNMAIDQLEVTEANALNILRTTKLIDFLAGTQSLISTYSLRKAALCNASTRISTSEAFTRSLNPRDFNDLAYLADPQNWINERVERQAQLIIDYTIRSRTLTSKMKKVVIATRGGTGVGKTNLIDLYLKELLFSKYLTRHLLEHDNLTRGVLNPDRVKKELGNDIQIPLLNGQVYLEGRMVFERFLKRLTQHTSEIVGALIDTRMLTLEDFREVLAFSRGRRAKLEIIDIDAPIWYSILSVLNRVPYGKDPCVPFEVIKDGYIRAHADRSKFIAAVCSEQIGYYLYHVTKEGDYALVAKKGRRNNSLWVDSKSTFDKCLQVPSEEETESIASTVITHELIQSLEVPVNRRKDVLFQWIGHTIKDALEIHAKGGKP